MTGLFCFDGPLYKDKNGIYCNITLTNEMFNRYFSVVNKLIVIVRTYIKDEEYKNLNMKPLQLNHIEIIEADNLNSVYGQLIYKRRFAQQIESQVQKADMIFARMPSSTSDVVIQIAKKYGKKYLVEVGGCAWDAFWNHGILGKLAAPYMHFREKRGVLHADYAVYVTKYFLQERYPCLGKSESCSNVYLTQQPVTVLRERINKISQMDYLHIVLGQAVNSIDVKYKGEYLIVQVLAWLKERGIRAEFQIVGPGNGEYIRKLAEKIGVGEQVAFIGTLNKDQMTEWYKSIDIYVQPSRQEGLPRSVIEAMNVGCPCLGSRIAGIPELLDEECLFNPNKIKTIETSLLKLLNERCMKSEAEKNFYRAKEYDILLIEQRRKQIFQEYRNGSRAKA